MKANKQAFVWLQIGGSEGKPGCGRPEREEVWEVGPLLLALVGLWTASAG